MAKKKSSSTAKAAKPEAKANSSVPGVVKTGDKVTVEYVGSFTDGKIFDASVKHGRPIEFTVGSGQVVKGFDNAVVGMAIGEEKVVKLTPDLAYGERRAELQKVLLRKNLPADKEPKPGMALVLGLANGVEVPARITKVEGEMVTIDLNHPLAGKNLNFKIKVVGIN
jgi:peptidylprolyl isomerase